MGMEKVGAQNHNSGDVTAGVLFQKCAKLLQAVNNLIFWPKAQDFGRFSAVNRAVAERSLIPFGESGGSGNVINFDIAKAQIAKYADLPFKGRPNYSRSFSGKVVLVGKSLVTISTDMSILASQNLKAYWFPSLDEATQVLSRDKPQLMLLIVHLDQCGSDLDDAVEQLCNLRICLKIPTIVTSSSFSKDDFSLSRKSICDASLKFPYTSARLNDGIEECLANFEESFSSRVTIFGCEGDEDQ